MILKRVDAHINGAHRCGAHQYSAIIVVHCIARRRCNGVNAEKVEKMITHTHQKWVA
jgi:hypothetical protein